MSNQFGKITLSAGVPIREDVGGTGLSGILIGNESGYTCKVTLEGANVTRTLYPGTVDFFEVPANQSWNGNLIILPSTDLSNVSSWPGSYVYVDTFGLGERPSGQFPLSLNRAGNVGNSVGILVGSSTNVQNDNNAAGTSVVEATVLGSPTSNIQMYNDGSGWFGMWVNPTFTKVFQWFSTGTTILKLAAATLLTEILGNLKVDGTTELVGNTTIDGTLAVTGDATHSTLETSGAATLNSVTVTNNASVGGNTTLGGSLTLDKTSLVIGRDGAGNAGNVFGVDSNGNTFLQFHPTNKQFVVYNEAGVNVATMADNVNGATLTMNKFALTGTAADFVLLQGSISRISKFTGTSAVGKVTVNHGLGAIPDLVFVVYNVTGTPSAATIAVNYATLTSTQVDVWSSLSAPFVGIAIRF